MSRVCKLCEERKADTRFKGSDDLCDDCGGGKAERCARCRFWWPVGVHIDKDRHLCSFCSSVPDSPSIGPNDHIVYFARCGEFVKIGVTLRNALDRRMGTLQIGNPLKIDVVGIEAGSRRREAYLHRKFADLHERGEWFALTGPLRDYVNALEKP